MVEITGRPVGSIGYGLMGLTWRANPPSQSQAFDAMRAALNGGANLWNGGEFYGTPERNSLHLLNEYFSKYPEDVDKVVLSIKGGISGDSPATLRPDGSEKNVRRSVDECLRILEGKKKIDIFQCARVDPDTPIEETVKVLANLVKEGKIGSIGLSEVGAKTIRRASKVHPIAAVEVELSLWATDIMKNEVAGTCAELGIPITAYSPLMRGALAGQIKTIADIPKGDIRSSLPKFQAEVFKKNMAVTKEVEKLAKMKEITLAQVAIGWVRTLSGSKGMPTIIPIPGATTVERVEENGKEVILSEEEMKKVDQLLKENEVIGDRYGGPLHKLSEG